MKKYTTIIAVSILVLSIAQAEEKNMVFKFKAKGKEVYLSSDGMVYSSVKAAIDKAKTAEDGWIPEGDRDIPEHGTFQTVTSDGKEVGTQMKGVESAVGTHIYDELLQRIPNTLSVVWKTWLTNKQTGYIGEDGYVYKTPEAAVAMNTDERVTDGHRKILANGTFTPVNGEGVVIGEVVKGTSEKTGKAIYGGLTVKVKAKILKANAEPASTT